MSSNLGEGGSGIYYHPATILLVVVVGYTLVTTHIYAHYYHPAIILFSTPNSKSCMKPFFLLYYSNELIQYYCELYCMVCVCYYTILLR